jgi:hypothetical protein
MAIAKGRAFMNELRQDDGFRNIQLAGYPTPLFIGNISRLYTALCAASFIMMTLPGFKLICVSHFMKKILVHGTLLIVNCFRTSIVSSSLARPLLLLYDKQEFRKVPS